jgi:phosphoribosylformimino-5-aminoimidazole carboxamide ribotide isomerase
MAIMLDAGASNAQEVRSVLALGVQKAVVGAETLNRRVDLRTIIEAVDPDQLVFSLDMRAGKVLSRCSELAALPVLELLGELQAAGWREVILLDLSRVGTGQGALSSIILETKMDLKILIGGGISGLEELIQLKLMGVEGALLATAFHNGTITNSSLRVLELL